MNKRIRKKQWKREQRLLADVRVNPKFIELVKKTSETILDTISKHIPRTFLVGDPTLDEATQTLSFSFIQEQPLEHIELTIDLSKETKAIKQGEFWCFDEPKYIGEMLPREMLLCKTEQEAT